MTNYKLMTDGQRESLNMLYVSATNGTIYGEDLYNDKTLPAVVKRDVALILNKFAWIKRAMELRTDGTILRTIDTLRYDEILRLVCNLSPEQQDRLELLIKKFVDDELDKM